MDGLHWNRVLVSAGWELVRDDGSGTGTSGRVIRSGTGNAIHLQLHVLQNDGLLHSFFFHSSSFGRGGFNGSSFLDGGGLGGGGVGTFGRGSTFSGRGLLGSVGVFSGGVGGGAAHCVI